MTVYGLEISVMINEDCKYEAFTAFLDRYIVDGELIRGDSSGNLGE